jgi:hypothetical protein
MSLLNELAGKIQTSASPSPFELLEVERSVRRLPTAIVAGLLVVYFGWRARLRNRLLADPDDHRPAP